jgi:hypothetical protein
MDSYIKDIYKGYIKALTDSIFGRSKLYQSYKLPYGPLDYKKTGFPSFINQ